MPKKGRLVESPNQRLFWLAALIRGYQDLIRCVRRPVCSDASLAEHSQRLGNQTARAIPTRVRRHGRPTDTAAGLPDEL